jgi:ketosteroid isomerase-like protein
MTRTPEEVFQHHAVSLGAGDLDEIVADYADDAVFITPAGIRLQTVRYTLQHTS